MENSLAFLYSTELLKEEQFEDISNWNAQKYSTHTPVVTGNLDLSRTVTAGFARAGGAVNHYNSCCFS
ncbi:hypothetical protein WDW89_09265 [Deltaproteobacteria bacterium TL4]